MNKTDNTDNIYIDIDMPERLYNSIRVYDGNQNGITYDFYLNKTNNLYNVSERHIFPEYVKKNWNPTILTRDQWSKFLNLLTLLSIPILSYRFDVDNDEFNKSRSPNIFMASANSDFTYKLKRDIFGNNRILVSVIDTPTYQVIQDSRIYKPILPYDKGLEDKIRTYLDGITRFLKNNIFEENLLIKFQQDIKKC